MATSKDGGKGKEAGKEEKHKHEGACCAHLTLLCGRSPRNMAGKTPLIVAAGAGHVDVGQGPARRRGRGRVREMDFCHQSVLGHACEKGQVDVVRMLLDGYEKCRESVNGKDTGSQAPLFWAAINGHAEIVTALLDMNGCRCRRRFYRWEYAPAWCRCERVRRHCVPSSRARRYRRQHPRRRRQSAALLRRGARPY